MYDKILAGEQISEEELEQMASVVHNEWLKRNNWVFDPNYGDPKLAVPYLQLSTEEQEKDKIQIKQAVLKVLAFVNGLIDIEALCEQYNIEPEKKY